VDGTLVASEARRAVETHRALATDERTFASVRPQVHLESAEGAERARAIGTRVGPGAGVDARMEGEQRRVFEASTAHGADVRCCVRVCSLVVGARAALSEALRAAVDATHVRPFAGVRAQVRQQGRALSELASTNVAHFRALAGGARRRRSTSGGGDAVVRGVRPMLMHCEERRERERVCTNSARVTRRRLTRLDDDSPFSTVCSFVSQHVTGVPELLATDATGL